MSKDSLLNYETDEVDLLSCDREPIHRIGQIQPFAFLFVLDRSGTLTFCSQNVAHYLRRPAEELLGRSFQEISPPGLALLIQERLGRFDSFRTVDRLLRVSVSGDLPLLDLSVHRSGEYLIVECEPSQLEPSIEPMYLVKSMISEMEDPNLCDIELCERATQHLKRITGFDRVMTYRFEPDGSGEVVAERKEDWAEPFLGLHYPAEDIPAQARRLYKENTIRVIRDVREDSSPLIGSASANAPTTVDLTHSFSRSVSKIHLEYLENMGVRASMSVSILQKGELWGLFALHHYAPRLISLERRNAAELYGQMFSYLLDARIIRNEKSLLLRLSGTQLRTEVDLKSLCEIFSCDGAAVVTSTGLLSSGFVPDAKSLSTLQTLIANRDSNGAFAVDEFKVQCPGSGCLSTTGEEISGLLAIPLKGEDRGHLILFRLEKSRQVKWAGRPEKVYEVGPLGPRLSPRKSFEAWVEESKGKAIPWSTFELQLAEVVSQRSS